MRTFMSPDDSTPSQATLDRAPARGLMFLLGVGRSPVIRAQLATRGYTDDEHERGWELLRAVDPSAGTASTATSNASVSDAVAKLDAWDNQNLPIADVALRKRAPRVHAFLFSGGLAPADGIESVRVVDTFLGRIDKVADVAAREGRTTKKSKPADEPADVTPDEAREALKVLGSRGISASERQAARGWLNTAQKGAAPATPAAPSTVDRTAPLVDLHDWVTEWTLVARKVLKRRDHLINIGVGEKKSAKRKPKTPAAPSQQPA